MSTTHYRALGFVLALTLSFGLFFVAVSGPVFAGNDHSEEHDESDHHDDNSHHDDEDQDGGHGHEHDGEDGDVNTPPVVTGSITVCKIVVDSNNVVVDGSSLATTTTFTIPGTGMPSTVFTTPLVLNAKILSDSSVNDAACTVYSGLSIMSYAYGMETIVGSDDRFETPLYNDQYTTPVNSVSDFYSFGGGNENADGSIILNQNVKDRVLVVLNKLKIAPNPIDVCSNIDGAQTVVPEGMHSEGAQCVANTPSCDEGQHWDAEAQVCVNNSVVTQCADGTDNDEDGLTDQNDPGCWSNPSDNSSYNAQDDSESADLCANLEGTQQTVPNGTHLSEGNCVEDSTGGGNGGNGGSDSSSSETTGGGGNGPVLGNGPISFGVVGGAVLGTSTTNLPELPGSCNALLHTYMRMGRHNDVEEVKKLQTFLNQYMGAGLTVSGFFGPSTDKAVREFQKKYQPHVLTPWGIANATGFVYKTTQRWINLTNCASLNIPMPDLTN